MPAVTFYEPGDESVAKIRLQEREALLERRAAAFAEQAASEKTSEAIASGEADEEEEYSPHHPEFVENNGSSSSQVHRSSSVRKLTAAERRGLDAYPHETDKALPAWATRPPVGLALSSGGLRACTFTLGFVQALHHTGLLRFCDYISSVSGGGFVSGHLAALADSLKTPTGQYDKFHTGAGTSKDRLGVDRNGVILPNYRFSSIGEYLLSTWHNPLRLFFRYLTLTFAIFLPVLGILGIVMTLAAIAWRCLDYPSVRTVFTYMGLDVVADQFNVVEETLVTFLIPIGFTLLLPCLAITIGILRLFPRTHDWSQPWMIVFRRSGEWCLMLAVVTWVMGFVVFWSNGHNGVFGSDVGSYRPSWLKDLVFYSAAALSTPLLFSKKLLDSAKPTASTWEKIFLNVFVTLLITCSPLLMFVWMVRENISEHVDHRPPTLLVDDVYNWNAFLALEEPLGIVEASASRFPDPQDNPGPQNASDRHQSLFKQNIPDPSPPMLRQIVPTAHPHTRYSELTAPAVVWNNRGGLLPWVGDEDWLRNSQSERGERTLYLDKSWNKRLGIVDPTDAAVAVVPPIIGSGTPSGTRKDVPGTDLANRLLARLCRNHSSQGPAQLIDEHLKEVTSHPRYPLKNSDVTELRRLLTTVLNQGDQDRTDQSVGSETAAATAPNTAPNPLLDTLAALLAKVSHSLSSTKIATVAPTSTELSTLVDQGKLANYEVALLNRMLLETLYPDIIKKRQMVSTYNTVGYDQQARFQWLGVWSLCAAVGLLLNLNTMSPLFEYYRKRLRDKFLVVGSPPPAPTTPSTAEVWPDRHTPALAGMQPWKSGAPIPIFVSSVSLFSRMRWRKDPSCDGLDEEDTCLADDCPPFVFTPLHSGSYMLGYRDAKDYCHGRLSLEDVVGLSGAPISPMTAKSWPIRMALGTLNARLGMWLPLPARVSAVLETEIPFINVPNAFFSSLDSRPADCADLESKSGNTFPVCVQLFLLLALALVYCGVVILQPITNNDFWHTITVLRIRDGLITFIGVGLLAVVGGAFLKRRSSSATESSSSWSWKRLHTWYCGQLDYRPVIDGVFHDSFGLEELLLRRCGTIIVVDGGRNESTTRLAALADCLRMMRERHGIICKTPVQNFLSLLEPNRELVPGSNELRLQNSHSIVLDLEYPPENRAESSPLKPTDRATLIYCQMSLTGDEELDIFSFARQSSHFPNESNANQFFTPEQAEAFRHLGYHVGESLEFEGNDDAQDVPRLQGDELEDWIEQLKAQQNRILKRQGAHVVRELEHAHGYPD